MKIEFIVATNADHDISLGTAQCIEFARWQFIVRNILFYWEILGGAARAKARSMVASHLFKTEADYIILIDRDMTFTFPDIYKIYEDLKEGYDLVSGIYCLRNGLQLSGYNDEPLPLDGAIYECKYIPTGFTGISKKLLQKMVDELKLPLLEEGEEQEHYPFFEEKVHPDKGFLGEDWDFCEKARDVGVEPYVDTKVQLGHIGEKLFVIGDYLRNEEEHIKHETKSTCPALENVEQDIADFFGVSLEDAKARIAKENVCWAENTRWMDKEGSAEDFYKDNEAIVYDLVGFNLRDDIREERYEALSKVTGKKILDIGCGIGTFAFILAEQGNDVLGYDINQIAVKFCNFRNERNGRKAMFTDEMPKNLEAFDIITATDMLEHIEDLGGFLKELGGNMKVGATLYHHDSFDNVINMMHFSENEKYLDNWLTEAGFMILNDKWCVKV